MVRNAFENITRQLLRERTGMIARGFEVGENTATMEVKSFRNIARFYGMSEAQFFFIMLKVFGKVIIYEKRGNNKKDS